MALSRFASLFISLFVFGSAQGRACGVSMRGEAGEKISWFFVYVSCIHVLLRNFVCFPIASNKFLQDYKYFENV
jgi:VIT1/CCC1 family predicted Fe2+/Mn2+ transporter